MNPTDTDNQVISHIQRETSIPQCLTPLNILTRETGKKLSHLESKCVQPNENAIKHGHVTYNPHDPKGKEHMQLYRPLRDDETQSYSNKLNQCPKLPIPDQVYAFECPETEKSKTQVEGGPTRVPIHTGDERSKIDSNQRANLARNVTMETVNNNNDTLQSQSANIAHSLMDVTIGFLNVCGLRRRLQYPEFTSFINDYDIICFAETKLDQYDLINVHGYTFYSQPRKQTFIRKSGGLGFLVRNNIANYIKCLHTESDYIACISLSKQFHNLEQDIVISAVYIPPQCSRFYNNEEYELMENDITSLCSQHDYVFLLGDFNAQTSTLEDFTTPDTFLSDYLNFDQDTINFYDQKCELERLGINITRKSMDRKKNNSGFELIDICKNLNLTILNGRFGQDKNKGAMTFRNISVIDYAIVSVKCFDLLKDFQIKGLDRIYSDGHSFLLLNIKTKSKPSTVQTQKPTTDRSYLNKKDYQRFVQNFDYTKMEILLNKMQMTDHASPAEVNGYVAEITDAFQAAATQINTNKSSNKAHRYICYTQN